MLLYGGINLLWDIRTTKTPPFHITKISGKVGVLHNAATFASSLLVMVGLFDERVRQLAGDTVVPLLLAGFSGLLVTLSEICPYKPSKGE